MFFNFHFKEVKDLAGIDVIKEYLVGMGLQDNFTDNFNRVIDDSSNKMGRFANTFAGKFAIAGVAVVSATAMANIAIGKFLGNMAKSDHAMEMYAKKIGKTKQEAVKLDTSLKAMGKTLEEVNSNAELKANFEQLQKDAEKVQPPDMSEGMKQIREIQFEFTRLKQNATYALNWIGYYLTKYLKDPIDKIQQGFKGLNDIVIKNMPKWTEKIAQVLSWVIRLGTTLMRGATTVFTAIKRIFDMIPKELKVVGAAIVGLGLLIRAGPIGQLIMILSAALLLLDDFYTYLDGGDALLGGLWQWLLDIWNLLKDSGAIDAFKKGFANALIFASGKINQAKEYLIELFNKFKESESVEKFINLIIRIKDLILELSKPILGIGESLYKAFTSVGKPAIDWFITKGLPKMIDFLSGIIEKVTDVIRWLNKFNGVEAIIWGIVGAFAAFKTITGVTSTLKKITESVEKFRYGLDLFKKGIRDIPGIVGKAKKAFSMLGVGANIKLIAIVGAIGLVIAAIVLIYKNWDKIKEKFGEVAEWMGEKIEAIKDFFIGLGNKIKDIFGGIGQWFKEKFSQAKEAIIKAFSPIGDYFSKVFENIGFIFSGVKALFSGNFQGAYDAVVAIWNNITGFWKKIFGMLPQPVQDAILKIMEVFAPIVEWFSNKVLAIIKAFSNIPAALKDTFINAVNAIKNVFSPIVDWFKEKVDQIKGFFGGIGDKVKGIFGGGKDKPDPDKPKPNPKPIGHAEGGVFFNKHEAEIAEDGAEAVIPLTKPNRAKEILSQIKNFISPEPKQPGGISSLDGIKQSLSQIVNVLSGVKNGLNEQQNISYTSTGGNVTINNITVSPQTHNKIYGSGNPETTANAINRNTINSTGLLLRNTQGVIG